MTTSCLERRLIGEILVERGLVRAEHLEKALAGQPHYPGVYIGEILIRMGYATEIDIVTALVLQCNLPYISISRHCIDKALISLIPAELARRGQLLPLDRIGNVLSLVMVDPLNEVIRQEVEQVTGCRVATFVSTGTEIKKALGVFYGD